LAEVYQGGPCKRGHSGLRYKSTRNCITCAIGRTTDWRQRNPDLVSKYMKHPNRALWHAAKFRAKQRGLEFDILPTEIVVPEFCPVFQIKLGKITGRLRNDTPSLDRVDNSLGYVHGNVRVISWRANQAKSNLSDEELIALGLDAFTRLEGH